MSILNEINNQLNQLEEVIKIDRNGDMFTISKLDREYLEFLSDILENNSDMIAKSLKISIDNVLRTLRN